MECGTRIEAEPAPVQEEIKTEEPQTAPTEDMINVSSGTHSKKTKDAIYPIYLREIEKVRKELKRYNISFSVKKIYSSNKLIAFLQGNILRFKVKSLSDIYYLNKYRNK